jgi:hypothetical protein
MDFSNKINTKKKINSSLKIKEEEINHIFKSKKSSKKNGIKKIFNSNLKIKIKYSSYNKTSKNYQDKLKNFSEIYKI